MQPCKPSELRIHFSQPVCWDLNRFQKWFSDSFESLEFSLFYVPGTLRTLYFVVKYLVKYCCFYVYWCFWFINALINLCWCFILVGCSVAVYLCKRLAWLYLVVHNLSFKEYYSITIISMSKNIKTPWYFPSFPSHSACVLVWLQLSHLLRDLTAALLLELNV